MSKIWKLLPQVHTDLVQQLLANRGLVADQDVHSFLEPSMDSLADPFKQFPALQKTLDRIHLAIENKELIYIYGDYDVDGLTSTAILWENLKWQGANVLPYIPHREKEGYGLNKAALLKLKEEGCSLVISVDCGITSVEEAAYAKEINLDLIITDHHRAPEVIPDAYAIVHTTQLCGAGIAFKIALAMNHDNGMKSLDLAALGTIADLQPLTFENRIITRYGIEQLRQNRRLGLKALCAEAKISIPTLRAWDVSFLIAPRLNAIGRMDHAMDGLRILLTTDVARAYAIADILKNANKMRQEFTTQAVEEARKIVAANQYSSVCTVVGEKWKEGVIGLVASRLVDEVSVPVIAITKMEGYAKGSARSFNNFNIIEVISQLGHLLEAFGGHPGAAGFTLKNENLDQFCTELNAIMDKTYTHEKKEPELMVDALLKPDDLSLNTVRTLAQFEPFGLGNEEPLFLVKEVTIRSMRTVGDKGKHAKLGLYKDGAHLDAIGFSLGAQMADVNVSVPYDFVGTLKEDNWNMMPKLQLAFKDFKPSFSY